MRIYITFVVAAFSSFSFVNAAPAALSCGSGLFLTPSSTCSATCPPTYFGDVKTGTCKRCYSHSVLECTSAKSTAATKCQARYYLNRGRCVPQALIPAGFYGSVGTGKVQKCIDGMKTCSTPDGTALTCKSGLYLSNLGCQSYCPPQTTPNPATMTCTPFTCFSPFVLTCLSPAEDQATSCNSPYQLQQTSFEVVGKCIIPPDGFFIDAGGVLRACPAGQRTCTRNGATSCLDGYLLSERGDTCLPIPAEPLCAANSICKAFTSTVVACRSGYYFYNGRCIARCDELGFFYNYWRGTCASRTCPQDSYLSTDRISCLSCDANNRQRLCTGTTPSFCPTSQVYDPATGACVDVCPTGQYKNAANACVDASLCPSGSYITSSTPTLSNVSPPPFPPNTCQPCPQLGTCENGTGRMTSCDALSDTPLLMVESGLCVGVCPATRTPWGCSPKANNLSDFRCLPTYPSAFPFTSSSPVRCLPCGGAAVVPDPTDAGGADIYATVCSAYGGSAGALACLTGYHVDTTVGSSKQGRCVAN